MAGAGRGGPDSRAGYNDERGRVRNLAAHGDAPAAVPDLRRRGALPAGSTACAAAPESESQSPPQQRRRAGRDAGSHPGEIPPSGEPDQRRRHLAGAHDRGERLLAARLLGRKQSRHEKPEPGFAQAQPAQQERRQGQHAGTIRGQRPVRGDRALFGRPVRRRDLYPQAVHRLRRRRRGGLSQRCAAVQRGSARQRGKHQRERPPVQHRPAAPRTRRRNRLDPGMVVHAAAASLSADVDALQRLRRTARRRRTDCRLQRLRRGEHPGGGHPSRLL